MCMCGHKHTCTYTHTCMHVRIRTHIYTHPCMHTHIIHSTFRIVAVSNISAIKVDTPFICESLAPTLASIQSTMLTVAESHGTKQPICAINTIVPICNRDHMTWCAIFRVAHLSYVCWLSSHIWTSYDLKHVLVCNKRGQY